MTDTPSDAVRALVPQIDDDAQVPRADDVSAAETLVASILERPLRDGVHLRAIAAARRVVDEADAMLIESVRSAIAAGDSWTMVGLALRTSKQNAHRKFAPLVGEVPSSPGRVTEEAALNEAIERVARELEALVRSSPTRPAVLTGAAAARTPGRSEITREA